jgi:hypothetical protein
MGDWVHETILCDECGVRTRYSNEDCIRKEYRCKQCGHVTENSKITPNIKEYIKNGIPSNISYLIEGTHIYVNSHTAREYLKINSGKIYRLIKKGVLIRSKSEDQKNKRIKIDWLSIVDYYRELSQIKNGISAEEASIKLTKSIGQIRTLCNQGIINGKKFEGRWYIFLADD